MTKQLEYKIIILGMSEVGKTCLLINYFDKKFKENNISTIGIDFKTKFFKFDENKVKINYVDTAGQERFHAISSNFLIRSSSSLLMDTERIATDIISIPRFSSHSVLKISCIVFVIARLF